MKLADAETLLKVIKLDGPIKEHWEVLTDEGILLEAEPMGVARGAYDLRSHLLNGVCLTVIPKQFQHAAYEGIGRPHRVEIPFASRFRLWAQEAFVYHQEARAALRHAIEMLDGVRPLPRIGELEQVERHGKLKSRLCTSVAYDSAPWPEDFDLFFEYGHPMWGYGGFMDVSKVELAKIKREFCELLEHFVAA